MAVSSGLGAILGKVDPVLDSSAELAAAMSGAEGANAFFPDLPPLVKVPPTC